LVYRFDFELYKLPDTDLQKKYYPIVINLKPMTREEALMMEEKLAWDLRRQGYAVWFN